MTLPPMSQATEVPPVQGAPAAQAGPEAPAAEVEVTSDFVALRDLVVPGDLRIVPGDAEGMRLRTDLAGEPLAAFLDDLLEAGYRLRRSWADDGVTSLVLTAPVPARDGAVLKATGEVSVADRVRAAMPVLRGRRITLGAEVQWTGHLEAEAGLRVGRESLVHGDATAPTLWLSTGARIDGRTRAAQVVVDVHAPVVAVAGRFGHDGQAAQPALGQAPAPRELLSQPGVRAPAGFPGPYVLIARVHAGDGLPDSLRRLLPDAAGTATLDVLGVDQGRVTLLQSPGTTAQTRHVVPLSALEQEPALAAMLAVQQRVTKLRFAVGEAGLMLYASSDSIRWLITVFGKALSIQSRLGRLDWMVIDVIEGQAPPPKPAAPKKEAASRKPAVPKRAAPRKQAQRKPVARKRPSPRRDRRRPQASRRVNRKPRR